MWAFRRNMMYTGLCMTKVHCDALHARLLRSIRSAMLKDDDDLFEPRLQIILKKTGEDGKNGEASNKPDAKKKAGKKGDPDGAMEPDATTTTRKAMGAQKKRVVKKPKLDEDGSRGNGIEEEEESPAFSNDDAGDAA